ncbi:Nucleotidylyl transferase, partial [Punctularia strigosozonata HHB-11173 SS5]|uniref:Nucleotidylyl transferase n=1 Tax=Punctularia strigosozonata (strain HHB-11173) TaxID=741275 RepID=UPI0004416FF3
LLRVVALGGTFDHLHAGHKILLSMAAWIASEKIIVGVTDDALLQNKSNKHVLEDLSTRSERVRAFLALFRPGLVYDIVSIKDVAGPTGWDPDIHALVVSRETISGASAIDKIRTEKGLPPLRTFVIDVISAESESIEGDSAEALKQAKMSSTYIREWIVKYQLEKAHDGPKTPDVNV